MKRYLLIITALSLLLACTKKEHVTLGKAEVHYSSEQIVVSTGRVERTFKITPAGMVTTSYIDLASKKDFIVPDSELKSDWNFPALTGEAVPENITARISEDDGFTGSHIEVAADFVYPDDNLNLRYVIWVYPDAPGIRTQLLMKTTGECEMKEDDRENTTEQLAIDDKLNKIMFWGYADGTQSLNQDSTPIMKRETLQRSPVKNDWASGICLFGPDHGFIMIKESTKCFNSRIVANNGRFLADEKKVVNTGSGYSLVELNEKEFKSSWASWTMLYTGGEDDMQLTVKKFDRLRYPVDKNRDMYMIANTWGSATTKRGAKLAAREENVLREIDSQADLGIDVQQIDDGWQGCNTGSNSWRPVDSLSLNAEGNCDTLRKEVTDMYPSGGWGKVKTHARGKYVRLGLWVHGGKVTYDDLVWNYEQGGFMAIKYDFFSMKTKAEAEVHFQKVRDFISYTKQQVRVNWDVTGSRRVGYYFGRDLGAIYLANRKAVWPTVTIYRPHLILRDAWHLANYVNLNKFQVTVTNIDLVDKQLSDAYQYSHSYSFAISMMAVPVFFQETQLYSAQAREELKPLIAIYRQHRENIFDSYIFPVGEQPDNASYTGFQAYHPESKSGYLTIFRELKNSEKEQTLKLRFLKNKTIRLTNLLTDEVLELEVSNSGEVVFQIDKPADFRFFRYECI
jgi:hypothetical protein